MSRYSILAALVLMCCSFSVLAQGVTLVFNAVHIAPGQIATIQARGGRVFTATFDADNILVDKINAVLGRWNGMSLNNGDGPVELVFNAPNGVSLGQIATVNGKRARLDATMLNQIRHIVTTYFNMTVADLQ